MTISIICSHSCEQNIIGYIPQETAIVTTSGESIAERLVQEFAENNGISVMTIYPDYDRFHSSAEIIRNKQLVDSADYVIAVWDSGAVNIKITINYVIKLKKCLLVVLPEPKYD